MERERLAWVLLLSVPPAVGIAGFVTYVIRGDPLEPVALAIGLLTFLVLFGIIGFATVAGSADESRRGEGTR
jgi:hypothetical protein